MDAGAGVKRLLFIAYYFPPDGGAGAQRPAKFVRYLREFGWTVSVVTRTEPTMRGAWDPPDPSLASEVDSSVEIIRVPEPSVRDTRFARWRADDPMWRWADAVPASVQQQIRDGKWDAILITMSPFSLARMVTRFARLSLTPVILDLRDPWALDGWTTYPTWCHWRCALDRMGRALHTASGVIANTPEAASRFRTTWPTLDPSRMTIIPNGFDRDDFKWVSSGRATRAADQSFNIIHTGTLHSSSLYPPSTATGRLRAAFRFSAESINPTGRTLKPLLDSIDLLYDRRSSLASRVALHHFGVADEHTARCIREHPRGSHVVIRGYLAHLESVRSLQEADGLFLPLHGLPHGERSLIVPGKTYEYLASGRPILACLPHGDARDLAIRTGIAFVADPVDSVEISVRLEEMLDAIDSDALPCASLPDWILDFDRRSLAERLAIFLDATCSRGPP